MPSEIGSEFAWEPEAAGGDGLPGWLPARRELFATACGAMVALLRMLAPRGRLHVPSYFCTGVAEALAEVVPVAWYRHLPGEPRWDTLRAEPGDVVLIQNLFGRDSRPMDMSEQVVIIEDHSHDPFGAWPATSTADYAVASLRKTLPLPDGGLLWSPKERPLPFPYGSESPAAARKLTAMLLKAAWLDGRPVSKDEFRELQLRGEHDLLGCSAPASVFTRTVLPSLDVAGLRARDAHAARTLAALLPRETDRWRVEPLGDNPFRVQLRCRTGRVRDTLRDHLRRDGIYAPVHWPQNRNGFWSGDPEAAALAARLLTLPADHRCGPADLRRIAATVGDAAVSDTAGTAPSWTRASPARPVSRTRPGR